MTEQRHVIWRLKDKSQFYLPNPQLVYEECRRDMNLFRIMYFGKQAHFSFSPPLIRTAAGIQF